MENKPENFTENQKAQEYLTAEQFTKFTEITGGVVAGFRADFAEIKSHMVTADNVSDIVDGQIKTPFWEMRGGIAQVGASVEAALDMVEQIKDHEVTRTVWVTLIALVGGFAGAFIGQLLARFMVLWTMT